MCPLTSGGGGIGESPYEGKVLGWSFHSQSTEKHRKEMASRSCTKNASATGRVCEERGLPGQRYSTFCKFIENQTVWKVETRYWEDSEVRKSLFILHAVGRKAYTRVEQYRNDLGCFSLKKLCKSHLKGERVDTFLLLLSSLCYSPPLWTDDRVTPKSHACWNRAGSGEKSSW